METNIIDILFDNYPENANPELEALDIFPAEHIAALSSNIFDSDALNMLVYENIFADDLADLEASVGRVSEGFEYPAPEVFHSENSYGEYRPENPFDPADDRIGADIGIVQSINASYGNPHAYDVITAHEMAHAKLVDSGLCRYLTSYAEEVLCDIYSGIYSGHNGLPAEVFTDAIGDTPADAEHPAGPERADFYLRAYELAAGYPADHPFFKTMINNLINEAIQKYNC